MFEDRIAVLGPAPGRVERAVRFAAMSRPGTPPTFVIVQPERPLDVIR